MSAELEREEAASHLRRSLGRRDLVLLFVVAIVNLNVVPAIAANGPVTIWLWIFALVFFFWPQGIAVIELSQHWPGEGGVYLWAKEVFGDFHGFLAGWCYWTNNVFYVPTVILYFVGVTVFVAGPQAKGLADNSLFTFGASFVALWVLVALNVRGITVGKWVNNLGGIGTAILGTALIGLGVIVFRRFGTTMTTADFRVAGADWHTISAFGVICFGLVGLELASIMGDEIKEPLRTVPFSVLWGGLLSGILYIGATLTLILAVPKSDIGVLQGVLEAITRMAGQVGVASIVTPLALILSISIAGIASAWLSGSARIPFVAGLDRYLPAKLGELHPRFASPYIALIVHGALSTVFLAMSFIGASVKEAFVTLLDLAVVLQLVPFLYMYAALIKLAFKKQESGFFRASTLHLAGFSGLMTTILGMVVAFVPSRQISSVWLFEAKLIIGCIFFTGLAVFFFYIYGRRKMATAALAMQGD